MLACAKLIARVSQPSFAPLRIPLPGVFYQVRDSDDKKCCEGRSGVSRRASSTISDAKASLPKSVVEAAAKHLLSFLGPQGLKWVARQMRAPFGPVSGSCRWFPVLGRPTTTACTNHLRKFRNLLIVALLYSPFCSIASTSPKRPATGNLPCTAAIDGL